MSCSSLNLLRFIVVRLLCVGLYQKPVTFQGSTSLAGCLLWSILPGAILRTLPESWHGPEKMAAHVVGEPSMWEAGIRLMRAGNTEGWQTVVDAAAMWRENREIIRDCTQAAVEAEEPVRCTIEIGAGK